MPEETIAGSIRQRRRKVLILTALVFAIVTSPIIALGLSVWAGGGVWEFTDRGFSHWIFVRGSTIDRLGLVAASTAPARFVVRTAEGTDPGATSVEYVSSASPTAIVEIYADRCRAMGLATKVLPPSEHHAKLVCEGDRSVAWADDVYVFAERLAKAVTTQVLLVAGPGLVQTYNF